MYYEVQIPKYGFDSVESNDVKSVMWRIISSLDNSKIGWQLTIYVLSLEDMYSFLIKSYLSTENIKN